MKDNDLIRRGDAFTLFQKQYIDTQEGTDHVAIRINIGITKCIHAMQDIPAVDAVEVRHGRWVQKEDKDWAGGGKTMCSGCKYGYSWKMYFEPERFKYCPNCGARMDGQRREEGDA